MVRRDDFPHPQSVSMDWFQDLYFTGKLPIFDGNIYGLGRYYFFHHNGWLMMMMMMIMMMMMVMMMMMIDG